ncbi:glycoside hydrolase family 97 protein [Marinifilum caeruleilacunae]|uniref:Glycoside hydrolase family 97 protein n=1 Tax=Marinifilum caeruleilacunae TaxID=2499076 RepID=A0ABX1WXI0_9BACT|nr:glycoside hydrolase family 97 protein [Marinifilum caeruleilacunae]NOU60789.1 glycoside hydrolase family 97 protein [Marinifilum caeruleilacunae]
MKRVLFALAISIFICACTTSNQVGLKSPSGDIAFELKIDKKGQMHYSLLLENKEVIASSKLGMRLQNDSSFTNGLRIVDIKKGSKNEVWKPVWGPNESIREHYNELILSMRNHENKKLNLYVRLFDDGLGFRYEIPKQDGIDSIHIMKELTEFNFVNNGTAWTIPANYESYEMLYRTTTIDQVKDANTPATFKTNNGNYFSIHEANLTNFAGMTLINSGGTNFQANLVPWPDGVKVRAKGSVKSPWRTITISKSAAGLVESNIIQNLNEPCVLENTSWIEPLKYIGIWWGMHLGVETWTMGPKHGATTENMKKYIDFATENGVHAVLAEGWNTGWENWGKARAFDQQTPYADFDFDEIVRYAKAKKVELVGHHETGGDYIFYEECMEDAFAKLHDNGIRILKTGYAGPIPNGHFHHGQKMVQHYRKVVETAAKYQLMIDAHEPIKATGISRTYPNMMTREGARGMEWNGWSEGNPPEHHVILPFTRCLGGPIDYTPGTFDILYKNRKDYTKWNSNDKGNSRVNTTIAKQLALWVCLYSPLQMASDLVSNYEGQPAFKFFEMLPADFDESKVLAAEIGDVYSVARRKNKSWYIGSITDENRRNLEIKLSFLEDGKKYMASIFEDGEHANLENNPTDIKIRNVQVDSKSVLHVKMIESGGQAVAIVPIVD